MKTKILLILVLLCTLSHSCDKGNDGNTELSINKNRVELYSLEKHKIIVSPSPKGCSFKSENDLVASVTNDGEVTGMTIGSTNIIVSNPSNNFETKCNITIIPKYNLFKEPYLDFGATKSQIKAKEKRRLSKETSTGLAYVGENSYTTSIMYGFNDSGKMIGAAFLSPTIPTSNIDKILGFVLERYYPIDYDMSKEIFYTGLTNDKKIGIGLQLYETSIMGLYAEIQYSKSTSTSLNKQLIDIVKSLQ